MGRRAGGASGDEDSWKVNKVMQEPCLVEDKIEIRGAGFVCDEAARPDADEVNGNNNSNPSVLRWTMWRTRTTRCGAGSMPSFDRWCCRLDVKISHRYYQEEHCGHHRHQRLRMWRGRRWYLQGKCVIDLFVVVIAVPSSILHLRDGSLHDESHWCGGASITYGFGGASSFVGDKSTRGNID